MKRISIFESKKFIHLGPKPRAQLALVVCLFVALPGCQLLSRFDRVKPILSPYEAQRIWAVLPIQNESGFHVQHTNAISQELVKHFESAGQIEVWPMSRTLSALSEWQDTRLEKPEQAAALMRYMGVDGLVVSSLIAYQPYDPPIMGVAMELYLAESALKKDIHDVRALVRAATDPRGLASGYSADQTFHIAQVNQLSHVPVLMPGRPVSTVSFILDAKHPNVRKLLDDYSRLRAIWPERRQEEDMVSRYQLSMPLYQDFVTYEAARRLLDQEWHRFEQIEWMSQQHALAQQQLQMQSQRPGSTGGVRRMYQLRRKNHAVKRRY